MGGLVRRRGDWKTGWGGERRDWKRMGGFVWNKKTAFYDPKNQLLNNGLKKQKKKSKKPKTGQK